MFEGWVSTAHPSWDLHNYDSPSILHAASYPFFIRNRRERVGNPAPGILDCYHFSAVDVPAMVLFLLINLSMARLRKYHHNVPTTMIQIQATVQ